MPSALYFLICVLIIVLFNMRLYILQNLPRGFIPLQDALANYGKRFDFYAQNAPFCQPIFVNLHSIIE